MTVRSLAYIATIAAVATLGLFGAACGDDDDSGGGALPGGSASYDSYVSSICKAELKLEDAIRKIDPSKLSDPKSAADVYRKPIEEFTRALKAVTPPKDLKPYHDELVTAYEEVGKLQDGTLDAISEADSSELPPDLQDRLTKAAAADPDCQKTTFGFG